MSSSSKMLVLASLLWSSAASPVRSSHVDQLVLQVPSAGIRNFSLDRTGVLTWAGGGGQPSHWTPLHYLSKSYIPTLNACPPPPNLNLGRAVEPFPYSAVKCCAS